MEFSQEEQEKLSAQMEAILFAAGDPVGVEQFCKGLVMTRQEVDELMDKLIEKYEFEARGMRILRLKSSYQMCSAPEHASVVREILETRAPPKLSQPALQVLAIVAYYEPTTRAYIEKVRGVDSAYTINFLLERGFIEDCGRMKEVPGRPTLYRTTLEFLRCFHMDSLKDLPDLGSPVAHGEQLSIEQRLQELEEEEKQKESQVEKEQPFSLENEEDSETKENEIFLSEEQVESPQQLEILGEKDTGTAEES